MNYFSLLAAHFMSEIGRHKSFISDNGLRLERKPLKLSRFWEEVFVIYGLMYKFKVTVCAYSKNTTVLRRYFS